MSSIRILLTSFALLLLAITPAHSGDWMKQAGDLMGGFGGGKSASPTASAVTALSKTDMVAGLKDALRVGSERVVAQLGKADGFNGDPKIHIPLPENLQRVKSALDGIGMGSMTDDLELKLNRAAEAATPKAKRIFTEAIRDMNIADAKKILNGPKDAATQYFKAKMSAPLDKEMRPVIEKAMSEVGAVQAYDTVMSKYQSIPFMPDVKANLSGHVMKGGLAGIFHYMAAEEAAIRANPAKRTTEILKKVFTSR